MVKHIVVVSDNSHDNITVYTEEPAFVVLADRDDLDKLNTLDEANRAGIYILFGGNQRYVGQASKSIISRLMRHDKNFNWWTHVIFFGREDGHLDKSQTDYLENKLISDFNQTSLKLHNQTNGNTSWIDKTSKILAEKLWLIVSTILQDVANINIYEGDKSVPETPVQEFSVVLPYTTMTGKNPSQCFVNVFKYLYNDEDYAIHLIEKIVEGTPNTHNLLGTEPLFNLRNAARTTELDKGLYLYTNMSTDSKRRALLRFAESINLEIQINW